MIAASLVLIGLIVPAGRASAQDANTDTRLREALRRTTIDLRAAQDAQATLQTQLEQMQRERDQVQQQLAAATAKAADVKPQAPAVPPADLAALSQAARAAQAQAADLQQALGKWQAAYRQAAGIAQQKDAEARACRPDQAARQRGRHVRGQECQAGVGVVAQALANRRALDTNQDSPP